MGIPEKINQTTKIDQFWHAVNIIAFGVIFMFSVLFSVIGWLAVDKLSSINTQIEKFVAGQKDQDLKIQKLEDTKIDKPEMK